MEKTKQKAVREAEVAGPNPARSTRTFFEKEASPRKGLSVSVGLLEPSKRLMYSFNAFSATFETFSPKSLAFLNTSSSIRMLVTIFLPIPQHSY